MKITHPNQLKPGDKYYSVRGISHMVVTEHTFRENYDPEQAHNDEDNKTICNWACYTTRQEAESYAN